MENNQIIDSEFASSHFKISDRAFGIMKGSGILAMLLGMLNLISILTAFVNLIQQFMSASSMMSSFRYYFIANVVYGLVDIVISILLAVVLFRYAMLVQNANYKTFQLANWENIFSSIKNIFLVFFLNLLIGVFFNMVYWIIGYIERL